MNSSLAVMVMIAGVGFAPPGKNVPPVAPAPPAKQQEAADRVAEIIADRVPQLHGSANWRRKTAVQIDITIETGGKSLLEGTMTYETNRRRARIDLKNGGSLIFDGQQVHVTATEVTAELARQHLETWTQVLAIPFLLHERNTRPTQHRMMLLRRISYDSIKLVHRGPDGKETDDWRVVFCHPKDHLIRGIGHVPLHPFVKDSNSKDTFAVMMDEYTEVEGVKLATQWTFWKWDNDLTGDPLGRASISNIQFVVPANGTFDQPSPTTDQNRKPADKSPDQPKSKSK